MSDDKLALLADTKETLRLTLGLRKDVPFSQYASHIPYYLKAGTVFDFANNQYSKDQLPVDLSDTSEFIRLSAATMWEDGKLVEVANNLPRIGGEGLLIEPQSTNRISTSNKVEWLNYNPLSTTVRMDSVGQALGVPISALECVAPGLLRAATAGNFSNGLVPATISAVVKAEGGGRIYLTFFRTGINRGVYFDPATEELEVIVGEEIADYGFERLSEGFYRIWVTRIIAPSQNAAGWVHYTIGLTDANVGDRLLVTLMGSADDPTPTSPIPTSGSQVTRSPDILNIPLLLSQSIAGDWDEGVTYEVADNISTFAGHGYIRNITVVDDPLYLLLFKGGEKGAWYDPSDLRTLFQDAEGTIPVTADGDPVGLMLDKSGNGNHVTQTVSAARPTYRSGDSRGTVNLLKWSEAFDNAAWAKGGVTVTPIETPSPVSGKIYELAATSEDGVHILRQSYDSLSSQSLRTFYVKKGTARYIAISVTLPTIAYNIATHATFDFDTGEWVAGMPLRDPALDDRGILPPVDMGDGWWALTIFRDTQYPASILLMSDASTTSEKFVGSGETCYVAAAQAELSFNVTPYQRNDSHLGGVATGASTDLHWLEADGADDQLISEKVFTVDEGFYAAGGFEVTAFGGASSAIRVFGVEAGIYRSALTIRGTSSGGGSQLGCMLRVGGDIFLDSSNNAFVLGESFVLSGWHESNVLYFSKNSGEIVGNIAADVLGASRHNNELIIFNGAATAPMRFYGGVWLANSIDDSSKLVTEKYLAVKSGVTL